MARPVTSPSRPPLNQGEEQGGGSWLVSVLPSCMQVSLPLTCGIVTH